MWWNSTTCASVQYRWIALISVCVFLNWCLFSATFTIRDSRNRPKPGKRKLILEWTTFYGHKVSHRLLEKLGCPVSSCDVTSDRSLVQSSDAVMFRWSAITAEVLKGIPEKQDNQRWILLNFESPFTTGRLPLGPLEEALDWTISYRRDSDFPVSYGLVRPRGDSDPPPETPPDRSSFERRRDIAWMTSHCNPPSQRDYLAARLRQYLRVDIYGKCNGGNRSLRQMTKEQGFEKLAAQYKLYFSFENALCREYATEKVFMPLYYGMIPVVWGAAKYQDFLPPNSYIDAKNFSTIRQLASHLKKVLEDYELYSSYFTWRKEYFVQNYKVPSSYLCDICASLFNDNSIRHRNITSWWNLENDCLKLNLPLDLPLVRQDIREIYIRKED